MKPSDYLDAVRVAIGAPSDYALQKPLSLSTSQLSKYRKNQDFFSDETAIKVATILGKHPASVILDMHRSRAKTPEAQAVWSGLAEKFSMGFEHLISRSHPRRTRLSAW